MGTCLFLLIALRLLQPPWLHVQAQESVAVIRDGIAVPPSLLDSGHSRPDRAIPKKKKAKGSKGDPDDCSFTVAIAENDREPSVFTNLTLLDEETVAPIAAWPFTVHLNGTITVASGLNFESNKEHQLSLAIRGPRRDRTCLLRVVVLDVDEPPSFINEPRPLLAVVPLSPPVGWHVFKFEARDEGGEGTGPVQYHLINQEPQGFFSVDSQTGAVRTVAREFPRGETFHLFVEALDGSKRNEREAERMGRHVAKLEIFAGERAPQFLRSSYEVEMAEDAVADASLVDVKAVSFRSVNGRPKGPISYYLKDATGSPSLPYFRIDSHTGIVHLRRQLDYDDPSTNRMHLLTVVADEDGMQSTATVTVNVKDINDNAPAFKQPLYSTHVGEDWPIGKTILSVEAIDRDGGENGRVSYALSDNGNFTVNDKGEIAPKRRLDADQLREGAYVYRFSVTATDHGLPSLSSMAMVHIRTENRNDEAPVFLPTAEYTAFVAEDAQGGTPVVQVQARDADRDQILYSLLDDDGTETTTTSLLTIDKDTGLIRLRAEVSAGTLEKVASPLNITVVAWDDGSCCPAGDRDKRHKATAVVRIGIEDINNNKPVFKECSEYSRRARLKEGSYRDAATRPVIITVNAEDEDSSSNGEIIYSLYHSQTESRKAFTIDKLTGELSPSPHVLFDRETRPREEVTVKATDKGDRPLIAFCQFSVAIVDVNDNAPVFDRDSYHSSISRHETPGTSILTVLAMDADGPANGQITYSLAPDPTAGESHLNDVSFVALHSEASGEIALRKELPMNFENEDLRFVVTASDNGEGGALSVTATVTLRLHESTRTAPVWQTNKRCLSRVNVSENDVINNVIVQCLARTVDQSSSIMYKLVVSSAQWDPKAEAKFRHFNRMHHDEEWVEVAVMESLDYETSHNYTLTITATDMTSYVSSSKTIFVEVNDENDSVPQFTVDLFTGTIDEELDPDDYERLTGGQPIVTVQAVDADSSPLFREVHYRIVHKHAGDDGHKFRIDERTGEIFPVERLDREEKDEYILTVEASDSAPSDLPGVHGSNKDSTKVRVVVADVNDNAPAFEEPVYEARVSEDAQIGHAVLTLKAHDRDKHSKIRYDIANLDATKRLLFGIQTETGVVFVKESLDFEETQEHRLVVTALDGRFNATTRLVIRVDDVNDRSPKFEQTLYSRTLLEEDQDYPKTLFRVRAVDEDSPAVNGELVYRLEGQGVGQFFQINSLTGEIDVIDLLDRDPPKGVPIWKMVVQAADEGGEGLVGYADVEVHLRDVNDNAPIFPGELYGWIDENRVPDSSEGVFVMRVEATDVDDPATDNARVEYSIRVNKEVDGAPLFTMDPTSGKLFAMRALDHEAPGERELVIEVTATDHGIPQRESSTNVTIVVRDKNDNEPYFEHKMYTGRVIETAPLHSAVLTLSAIDVDDGDPENILSYSLSEESDFFYMTTEADSSGSSVGVVRVKQVYCSTFRSRPRNL